jgi:hypothetical protein
MCVPQIRIGTSVRYRQVSVGSPPTDASADQATDEEFAKSWIGQLRSPHYILKGIAGDWEDHFVFTAPSTADVVDDTDVVVRLLDEAIAPPAQRKKAEPGRASPGEG